MIDEDAVRECWEGNAKTWTEFARAGYDLYRDFFNTPHFLRFLPEIKNLHGLDVGCGEGENTRALEKLGAKMKGIDISETFIKLAKEAEASNPSTIEYFCSKAQELPFRDISFDFATAFMSLMDMADLDNAFKEVFRVLKPGGFFQFSISHPCFDLPTRKKVKSENGEIYYILGDYFTNTVRINECIFGAVPAHLRVGINKFRIPYFHRTLSQWFESILKTGFAIEELYEPYPTDDEVKACPDIDDTRSTSYFLHMRVRKPE